MTNKIKLRYGIIACSVIFFLSIIGILYLDKINNNWKQEYVKIIETWKQENKEDILGYDFVYLNNDEIPELILYCYDEAWEGFDIYSVVKGKAVHLELYNLNGEKEENTLTSKGRQCQADSYIYKQGILLQSGGMMGSYWVKGYMYRKGCLEQIFDYSYINITDWSEDENVPISYEIKYVRSNGKIEKICKEGDVHFESCPELSTLEFEYGVSFSKQKDMTASGLLTYDDAVCFLLGDE